MLMLSKTVVNRIIILVFMVIVGFNLAKGLYYKSVMGVILAVVSLIAAVVFLYLLAKAKEEVERSRENEFNVEN
jgi:uncharacterized membrane protein